MGYQSDWFDILQTSFMRNALIGGTLVAIASGLVGYFVVVRQSAFAAHALAHIGFPGATAAILLGLPVTLGLAVFCLAGGLAIGFLGERVSSREIATGTVLAFATGLGVLFASLASESASTVTSVLFGNLLAISPRQLVLFTAVTAGVAVVMAVVARPAGVRLARRARGRGEGSPGAGAGRGVPRAAGAGDHHGGAGGRHAAPFRAGGHAERHGPPIDGAARRSSPARARRSGAAACWVGLVLAAMFNLPPSFLIVTLAFVAWAVSAALRGRGAAHGTSGHAHDHHHPPAVRLSA